MECAKCGYQFCWWCMDEFYTDWHYTRSNCPFRYCLLHSIEVAGLLLLFAKLLTLSPTLLEWCLLVIKAVKYVAYYAAFLG